MKLKLLLFLFAPLVSFSQIDSLRGKVKTITDTISLSSPSLLNRGLLTGDINDFGQRPLKAENVFSDFKNNDYLYPNGRFVNKKEFDSAGKILKEYDGYRTTYFLYDEQQRLLQKKETGLYSSEFTNYNYGYGDSTAFPVTTLHFQEKEPDSYEFTEYLRTRSGIILQAREHNSLGDTRKTIFSYDTAGRIIREAYYSDFRHFKKNPQTAAVTFVDTSDALSHDDFFYNDDGSVRQNNRSCTSNLLPSSCQMTIYKYDEKKRVSQILFYPAGVFYSSRRYSYNKDSTISKVRWFLLNDSVSTNYASYFYDKSKMLTKAILITGDKRTTIEFKYQFDLHNNWTEQVKIVDGKELYVRRRKISYWN